MGEPKSKEVKSEKLKTCFVISPIDRDESLIRKRSNQLYDHAIKPAVEECGYQPVRADLISEPGIITSQIIEHLVESELVIADLTYQNPNVYYELGIRHMTRKHAIQIVDPAQRIPFDIRDMRTIMVDYRFIDSLNKCRDEIIKQIKAIEKGKVLPISPVTFIDILKNVANVPEEQKNLNIQFASDIQSLMSEVDGLQKKQVDGSQVAWGKFEPYEVPTPSTFDYDPTKFQKRSESVPNIMKGKRYKICVFCGKKRAHGPYPLMKPNHAVCSSCIDNMPNYGSLMDKWEDGKYKLEDIIKDATKEYREYSENQ